MRVHGLTPSCESLWSAGAPALIGISPFNSHFDEATIRHTLAACAAGGREVLVFVPDEVTQYTLAARGYPPARAASKLRRQLAWLHNKIRRAADGRPPPVIGCADLAARPAYRHLQSELDARFAADPGFRAGCLDTTRWVLQTGPAEPVSEAAALLGVRYLLAELPLFLDAPRVLGRAAVVFVYHQVPALIADLYQGRFGALVGPGQGYATMGP